jgi:hypothetical protein
LELEEFSISGVSHLNDIGYYLGEVDFRFAANGEPVSHNVKVKVRLKDDDFVSFAEIEEQILLKAFEVIKHLISNFNGIPAKKILGKLELDKAIAKKRDDDFAGSMELTFGAKT